MAIVLDDTLRLVGSGAAGFSLTHVLDCHVYLFASDDHRFLIDSGSGLATEQLLADIGSDRLDAIFLTHHHADHAAGASELQRRTGATVFGSSVTKVTLTARDELATGLRRAKQAGFYPESLHFGPVDVVALEDDATVSMGRATVQAVETPGHCAGHMAFRVTIDDRAYLATGDALFFGGAVLLQDLPDVSVAEIASSCRRMESIEFHALLPGHGQIALRDGRRHAAAAVEAFDRLGMPPLLA